MTKKCPYFHLGCAEMNDCDPTKYEECKIYQVFRKQDEEWDKEEGIE